MLLSVTGTKVRIYLGILTYAFFLNGRGLCLLLFPYSNLRSSYCIRRLGARAPTFLDIINSPLFQPILTDEERIKFEVRGVYYLYFLFMLKLLITYGPQPNIVAL